MGKKQSVRAKISKKQEELKQLTAENRAKYTLVRTTKHNAAIIDEIVAQINAEWAAEMNALGIKALTRDDAIVAVLLVGMSQFGLELEELDEENNYMRVIEYNENNNIIDKEN